MPAAQFRAAAMSRARSTDQCLPTDTIDRQKRKFIPAMKVAKPSHGGRKAAHQNSASQ